MEYESNPCDEFAGCLGWGRLFGPCLNKCLCRTPSTSQYRATGCRTLRRPGDGGEAVHRWSDGVGNAARSVAPPAGTDVSVAHIRNDGVVLGVTFESAQQRLGGLLFGGGLERWSSTFND